MAISSRIDLQMQTVSQHLPNRRQLLQRASLAAAAFAVPDWQALLAQVPSPLDVASAGSFRPMLDGPLKTAALQTLQLDLRPRSGGADAVARIIVDASQPADVFIPVTEGPMRSVLQADKAHTAFPIARSELVLLYSPKSRFAPDFAAVEAGKRAWWEVLQQSGMKIARSNPADDPSGRCILFAMMLAAKKYAQPDLVSKVLGAPLNPTQVHAGINVRAGLEAGSIDAAASYKSAASSGKLPFLTLPPDVNLSQLDVRGKNPEISLTVEGKTFHPEPIVFYAAALTSAANPQAASRFVDWLRGEQASALLQANGFNTPGAASTLEA